VVAGVRARGSVAVVDGDDDVQLAAIELAEAVGRLALRNRHAKPRALAVQGGESRGDQPVDGGRKSADRDTSHGPLLVGQQVRASTLELRLHDGRMLEQDVSLRGQPHAATRARQQRHAGLPRQRRQLLGDRRRRQVQGRRCRRHRAALAQLREDAQAPTSIVKGLLQDAMRKD